MEDKSQEKNRIIIPKSLPIMPLRDTIIFPGVIAPLLVGRNSSIKIIEDISVKDKLFGVVLQRDPKVEVPDETQLYSIGCAVQMLRMVKLPSQQVEVLVQGVSRIEVLNYIQKEPYFVAYVREIEEQEEKDLDTEARMRNMLSLFEKVTQLSSRIPPEAYIVALNISSPGRLADFIAAHTPMESEKRQKILEAIPVKTRIEEVTRLLNQELEVLQIQNKIEEQTKSKLNKAQREFFLRQQLEAIKKELGEEDETVIEIKELEEKIKESGMPQEVEKEARRELERLRKLPPQAAEYTVIRTYLDWLINLPWKKSTQDNLDIARARAILDEDHYDLKKVKERILEYLAVRKLKEDMKGPILCFAGPPGVGKTSLGQSIARALGRSFVRISLGGVRDEAEIRGHRRTYVGALPGRIIQGIKRAGTNNPVFMLDEVDKIGL
ncbi:MAG: AAA family ATPase, partial [Caldiserica bacterium]|nr:AAA family ATPase [Caldisericota bacterium]